MRFIHSYFLQLMLSLFLGFNAHSYAINSEKYVVNKGDKANFPLASKGKIASILVSAADFSGVLRVVGHLENDLF
jgi:hypothetical protein